MTANEISQAGIKSNPINQPMNETATQKQFRKGKGESDVIEDTDTVKIIAMSQSSTMDFEAIDEETSNIVAQLVANDLSRQSFGITTQTGTEALRSFI